MDPKLERAIALAKLGRKDRARDICIEYLESYPDDVSGWVVLAQVVGERDTAIYCLEQILDIKPNDPWATIHLNRLRALQAEEEAAAARLAKAAQGGWIARTQKWFKDLFSEPDPNAPSQRDPLLLVGSIGIYIMTLIMIILTLSLR